MPLMINTNVASISAQNSMNKAQQSQNEAMERLTTGKRINTAADDAAGLSIANKMTSQVKGLNQAVRNANDGISMLQTAAGGLEESSNILQRMRELSVQSASGTYTEQNRDSMQAEVEQLKAELDRISETTTFNGQKILDGSQKDTKLQVGANANETIGFDIDSTAANKLGSGNSADVTGTANALAAGTNFTGTLTINNQEIAVDDLTTAQGEITSATGDGLQAVVDLFESEVNGISVEANVDMVASEVGSGRLSGTQALTFTLTEMDRTTTSFVIKDTGNMEELVDKINEVGGGRVEASLTDDGRLALYGEDIATLAIADTGAGANNAAGFGGAATTQAQISITDELGDGEVSIEYGTAGEATILGINSSKVGEQDITGFTNLVSTTNLEAGDLKINGIEFDEYDSTVDYDESGGAGAAADVVAWINDRSSETGVVASLDSGSLKLDSVSGEAIEVDFDDARAATVETLLGIQEQNATESSGGSVNSIDISTQAGAQKAIKTLDKAIEQVSDIQSNLGAVNNRLDFTVNNLSNVSENASAARSRIEDADFASESANLSRAKVLQQAGQTMLAQANSAPQQVLSLLQ